MTRPAALIVTMCFAEAVGMAGFSTFAALLPTFISEWGLTNTEAGWINSVFFLGYLSAVLILVTLTDRFDPRRIYQLCMVLSIVATGAFALAAVGFWSALGLRGLAGIGLAGTYMPGLKMLSDRVPGPAQSRAVAFYTASFSIGSSGSYYFSGKIEHWLDWQWAFGLATAGPVLSLFIVSALFSPAPPGAGPGEGVRLFNFLHVLRNRRTMGYILAYAAHNWELFGLRSWMVAFLVFGRRFHAGGAALLSPTTLAAMVNLVGVPSSILGNEFSARLGRRRVVVTVMTCSALLAGVVGFSSGSSPLVVTLLFLAYGVTVTADSASITAGALAEAPSGYRGTTMAVHSSIGFLGSFLGPLAVGIVLDLAGGRENALAWGLGFAAMGVGAITGPLALGTLAGEPRPAPAQGR